MIWNRGQNPQAAPGDSLAQKRPEIKLGKNAPPPGSPGYSLAYIEMMWKMEMDAAIARLHRRLELERKRLTRQYWARFWPVAVGIVAACFAPELRETLDLFFKPWGVGLVFPFVVLLERPELHLHGTLATALPHFMLYAEFPLEGLLAKSIIVGKVTPVAVFGRVACLHLLASTLLIMVSGAIT
jgi:hypothetical protein